ncbi:MAG: hypothetical protein RRA94_00615 [Bacteroidota bacterium]|nr:hypothetical protein [Bacteroidota bacterium]
MKTASFLLFTFLLMVGCSASNEELKTEAPPVAKKDSVVTPPPAARVYTYNDRYAISDAAIDEATNVDDPLQAIRVIQLKEGRNSVLVISSFDKLAEQSLETWFGIELPSFSPGSYSLADAANIQFYRFYLGDQRKRIDGESYEGTVTIEEFRDGYVSGYVDATINGVTKSFEEKSKPVRVTFTGSFRIQVVDLENTLMKTR